LSTRTKARQGVVDILYAYDSGNYEAKENYEPYLTNKQLRTNQKQFAINLIKGLFINLNTLDDVIVDNLHKGGVNDFGILTKAILRLGAYEILFSNTDTKIIISEALLVARDIVDDKSIKLINGVLDNLAKNNRITETNNQTQTNDIENKIKISENVETDNKKKKKIKKDKKKKKTKRKKKEKKEKKDKDKDKNHTIKKKKKKA
jgi:N utilization substance protein B